MSLLRPGVIKQTQTNQPIIYGSISLQTIWIKFVINLGRFDLGHFDSGTFWLRDVLTWMFWLWDVLTLGRFDLGRFDSGKFWLWDVMTLGRFDLGRFDFGTFWLGTFWLWDVLTLGRFDIGTFWPVTVELMHVRIVNQHYVLTHVERSTICSLWSETCYNHYNKFHCKGNIFCYIKCTPTYQTYAVSINPETNDLRERSLHTDGMWQTKGMRLTGLTG